MRLVLAAGFVVLASVLLAPAAAQDAKKDAKDKDRDKDAPQLVSAGTVSGKVVGADEAKRTVRIKINGKVPNPALVAAQAAYNKARKAKDQAAMQAAALEIQMHSKNPTTDEVDVLSLDDVVVRVPTPPPAFNEKGEIKRLTAAEIAKLRDPKIPGPIPYFPAEFSDLKRDQVVQITLMKKPLPRGVKEADVENPAEYQGKASRILVVQDVRP